MIRRFIALALLEMSALAAFAAQPAPKDVDLTGADGTKLKATYYAAGKSGPGVMLFHQCNRDRKMWVDVAPKLAAAGLNVLALDFRGFGESGGKPRPQQTPQEAGKDVRENWPQDVDKAYDYLTHQPGVNASVIGAAGASCGVHQSIRLSQRHPEVKSLVLLSGPTDRAGREHLKQAKGLPVFGSAADDDPGAVDEMEWIVSSSPNEANVFQHYKNGGHGIEMFGPHPELTGLIKTWFTTTLIKTPGKAPANKNPEFRHESVMAILDAPGGVAKANEMLEKAREKDPKAAPFSEVQVNLLGYEHIQAGDNEGAIEILALNAKAYPDSPNVYDSLSDAYLAAGKNDLALDNAKKALKMLESDTKNPQAQKDAIRASAEQKVKQLERR